MTDADVRAGAAHSFFNQDLDHSSRTALFRLAQGDEGSNVRGEAWAALLRDWLPASGLQLDARPCFEHYPTDAMCDPQTGAFECEICIPVMPL